ncbi:MAG: response regulator [Myxococcales bacterium]|nr:response regulator [Myxococcales bacterium]
MSARDTIICVDDEEGVLTVLEEQLRRRFGHECTIETAASAAAALELLEEVAADGDTIAVVIADQMMPGMVGSKLLGIVHERWPDAMKVLLTGQAGLEAVVEAINTARLNYYMSKPWDEAALLLAVDSLLRQFRLARENRALVEQLRTKN